MKLHPTHANPEEIAALAASWPDRFINCRKRHDWQSIEDRWDPKERVLEEVERCASCLTNKTTQIYEPTGEVIGRPKLDYGVAREEGYLLPPGTGRMTIAALNAVRKERTDRKIARLTAKAPAKKAAKKTTKRVAAATKRRNVVSERT